METIEREVLTLTGEEGKRIVFEDHEDFRVVYDNIDGQSRWSITHEIVVKRVSDGKFFMSYYSTGATESQDESPYEYGDAEFKEVFPMQETITMYK